ncbi:hypothetical protein MRB53_012283 [Persea americana]|uniref:Uncharacterized protein n=1 Tax=Persea americana TaxID=3435 RepID=A0ACC2LY68_PERAE|nr:hypothetical protein MRB53_012283 [Persea americana]
MLLRFLSSQSPPISCFHREQSFLLFWPCAYNHRTRRSRSSSLNAVDKESQFEIDREKAREALQKLDEQLETLSQKQITPKKRLPSSLPPLVPKFERDMMSNLRTREEMPEISGSYFAYSAVALLLLTFFNNIVFSVFIKPAVDGKDPAPATIIRGPPLNKAVVQQAPPLGNLR